jgi:hypothetical protein
MLNRLLVLLLLFAALTLGQESSGQIFRTGTDVVVAPTVVTTKAGDYINGLRQQDFQLTDNGKPQEIGRAHV